MTKPSLLLYLTEIPRAIYQYFRGLLYLKKNKFLEVKKNEIVLVIPGLLGTDWSTKLLRKHLSNQGYDSRGWELGRNYVRFTSLKTLQNNIAELSKLYNKKVKLVGWSMGGIFARELAKSIPEFISKVITIGSPYANIEAPNNARWVYDFLNKPDNVDPEIISNLHIPAKVPTISFYSKSDGIVSWEACMEPQKNELYKNIEINTCHFGMGMNPDVFTQVAKELEL